MIPKSFECMGLTFSVSLEDMEDNFGKYHSLTQRLRIAKNHSKQVQEQTFWHEFMHCALDQLGYADLNDNEQFVDQMAHCLYQLEKTRKLK